MRTRTIEQSNVAHSDDGPTEDQEATPLADNIPSLRVIAHRRGLAANKTQQQPYHSAEGEQQPPLERELAGAGDDQPVGKQDHQQQKRLQEARDAMPDKRANRDDQHQHRDAGHKREDCQGGHSFPFPGRRASPPELSPLLAG